MTSTEQLQVQCKQIADTITNPSVITASDYLSDAYDIHYMINQDHSYRSGEIAVALGGPTIYINTDSNTVEGYWGSDRVSEPFIDNLGVDDYLEESYGVQ